MQMNRHCNRAAPAKTRRNETVPRRWLVVLGLALVAVPGAAVQADVLGNLLKNAPVIKGPGAVKPPAKMPVSNPFGITRYPKRARIGVVTLSNGKKIVGHIWTTTHTPFRIWRAGIKQYRDIGLMQVQSMVATVRYKKLVRQWRWLQEGSDRKVYSGKGYPLMSLQYTFTLVGGKQVTGTVVAPLYVVGKGKNHLFVLWKHKRGKLGQGIAALVYVRHVRLNVTAAVKAFNSKLTTRLPLLPG